MSAMYRSGIPTDEEYRSNLQSERFLELEAFSNAFISQNAGQLKKYSYKWVKDPIHQWSRQWEYPFVDSKLQPSFAGNPQRRILDAGSGITFFPYYLQHRYEAASIHCCDQDSTLAKTFGRINRGREVPVEFSCSDLMSTPYSDNWFDCVYCISVLEHTANYASIIAEFQRILKRGGRLIVTFDLAPDGKYPISPENAMLLMRCLAECFRDDDQLAEQLPEQLRTPSIFTTTSAEKINPGLLPWRRSAFPLLLLRSLLSGKGLLRWPPTLTVFCLSVTKRWTD